MVHASGERVPISTENLLLRESRLKVNYHQSSHALDSNYFHNFLLLFPKNTSYVEGIVIYAGHESKAMLNNSGPRYKRSQLEQAMNVDVFWCVIILFIICSVGAIGSQLWISNYVDKNVPFIFESFDPWEGFWMFFRLVIIFQVIFFLLMR
jgi:phospholipid-translocating ATPase